jgi:hypothetical protein
MSVPTVAKTFQNILEICEARGRIIGTVKENDRDLIKGYIQEYNERITTERNWPWRSFDRSFNIEPAITTGTVAVTQGSKIITFAGLTVSNIYLGRSIRIDGTDELYRIIGVNTSTNKMYLESAYADDDNALATFRLYGYEFPLPPDCDAINNIYIYNEFGLNINEGELTELSLPEFNRNLSINSTWVGAPTGYCRDGKTYINSYLPPLDEMLLDYDFLGGDVQSKTERLRIFPIEPDKIRPIHLNYCKTFTPLLNENDEPAIPSDNRWMLVHFALYEWFSDKGQKTEAEKQLRDGKMILREMRNEHRNGQTKPRFIPSSLRYRRYSTMQSDSDRMFRISRALEY